MSFPSFGRLSRLYAERMMRLFHGGLFDMLEHPELGTGPEFRAAAWKVAQGMAREASRANATSWREAAAKSTRAREIYEALRSEIGRTGIDLEINRIAARNAAKLISSLPSELAQHISSFSAKQHLAGKRPEEVAREIRKYAPHLTKSKVRMIARTEVSKAETDLTQARAERIGVEFYQWETSSDQRVRESHKNMDKVLVRWNDPPSPEALVHEKGASHYNAGQTFNCRCLALPLISIDEIAWPCRVYMGNKITQMSRSQFTKVIGVRLAA